MTNSVILIALCLIAVVAAEDLQKTRVLVLLDNWAIKDSHSTFFADL